MKKALVLSLVLVLGLGVASFGQTLSGIWDTTISIVPSPVSLGITSTLAVTYEVTGWKFTSNSTLKETGWTAQSFVAGGALGAFTIGSTLTFTPYPAAFTKWVVTSGVSLAGVTFGGTFTLVPSNTKLELVGSGKAGSVDVKVAVAFGDQGLSGCDFNWTGVDITVKFPFYCANVTSTLAFDCVGFKNATFAVSGIAIPNLPWLSIDALLTFETQTKSLVLSPKFNFGTIACFNLYISEAHTHAGPSLTLGDFTIDGIGLVAPFGGVTFTGISYWGAEPKPAGLLKDTPYWEAYQIATKDDGCCGPFTFDVTAYFREGGLQLFDVDKFVANMSLKVATQVTFSTGISIDLGAIPAAFTKWTVGFKVVW
jgi:hypothetical protein